MLAIETSNPSAWKAGDPMPGVCVGVERAGEVDILSTEPCDPRSRDDVLLPAVDRAMRRAGLVPRDLGLIAVSVGPGGFTAVRIAVTAARMIAHATGAAMVGVPSAKVAAASAPAGESPFAVVLASKGMDGFVTRFERPFDPASNVAGSVMDASDLDALGIGLLIADDFLPEPIRAWADRRGVPVAGPVFDPAMCLRVALHAPATPPLTLTPMYPREPEAVRKWRELHPKPSH